MSLPTIDTEAAGQDPRSAAAVRIACSVTGVRSPGLINSRDRRAMAAKRIAAALLRYACELEPKEVSRMLGLELEHLERFLRDHAEETINRYHRIKSPAPFVIGPNYLDRYEEALSLFEEYFRE